jgi:enediyne polyketide synthase
LYGRILFHQGRFCRLQNYRHLSARECIAEISAGDGPAWFGPYLPAQFVLGDPAARDAALHAIQACIPHQRILPTGMDRLVVLRNVGQQPRIVRARERLREGNNFTYDVEVTDLAGDVIERWDGLRLRAVERIAPWEAWPETLLGPYLERRLEELGNGARVGVAFERGSGRSRTPRARRIGRKSDLVMQRALGAPDPIWWRPDGKPVVADQRTVSAAHTDEFTLGVAGEGRLACDLEPVVARTDAAWRDLLGPERFKLASRISSGQDLDGAATRLWNAIECLKKAGLPADAPLVLDSTTPDGWVLLRSGSLTIASCLASVRGTKAPLAVAVAFNSGVRANQPATEEALA